MSAHAVFITHRTKAGPQRSRAEEVWTRSHKTGDPGQPNRLAYVYTLPCDKPDPRSVSQLYEPPTTLRRCPRTPEYLEVLSAPSRSTVRRRCSIGTGRLRSSHDADRTVRVPQIRAHSLTGTAVSGPHRPEITEQRRRASFPSGRLRRPARCLLSETVRVG